MNSRLWPVAKSSWRPPARTAAAWPARRATTPTSRPWNPGNHHHIHLVDMVRSNFCHRQAFGLVRVVHLLILLFLDATYFYQFPFSSFDQLEKFRSFDRDPSKKSLQKTISLVVVFRWILNRLDGCFGLISSWSWVNVGQRYRVSWCSFNRVFFSRLWNGAASATTGAATRTGRRRPSTRRSRPRASTPRATSRDRRRRRRPRRRRRRTCRRRRRRRRRRLRPSRRRRLWRNRWPTRVSASSSARPRSWACTSTRPSPPPTLTLQPSPSYLSSFLFLVFFFLFGLF